MHAGRPTGPPSHGPGISPRSSSGSQVPSPVSGLCPCLHRLQSSGSLGTGAHSWFIGPCPGASCIETQRRHSAMGLALMHCRLFQGNAAPKGCFSLPIHAEKNIGRCKKLTPLRGRFCCYRSSHQDSSGLLACMCGLFQLLLQLPTIGGSDPCLVLLRSQCALVLVLCGLS